MQRISVHITDEIKTKITFIAGSKGKAEAEIIRSALKEGLEKIHPVTKSAQALLDIAKVAEKIPTKGKLPKDLINNLDYYTWGGDKNE